MKRILTSCLLVGLAVPMWAQHSKPTNVKVVPVPAAQAKPSAAKPTPKPAVIAVKPAPKTAIAVAPAKPAVAVVPAKPAVSSAKAQAKPAVAVVPVKNANPTPAAHVVVAAKPDQHLPKVMTAPKVVAVTGSKDPFRKDKKQAAVVVAAPVAAKAPEKTRTVVAVKDAPTVEKKPEPKKISAINRRDPFISPVVHLGAIGSGCSSGKRCLAIDQIALKGVVKSETGMIAVVVNAMDKAYFLRENDPVFNGYVTKITPDSVIFKETFRDKLGKELTRDVTKTISRPAA